MKVADKSNEITAVPRLLRVLELSGCIVTLDAMGCQKKIAKEIVEADADYVLVLKGNQETVHEEVKTSWMRRWPSGKWPSLLGLSPKAAAFPWLLWKQWRKTIPVGNGGVTFRVQNWLVLQTGPSGKECNRWGWSNRRVKSTASAALERRYYLSSLPLGVETFARAEYAATGELKNKLQFDDGRLLW